LRSVLPTPNIALQQREARAEAGSARAGLAAAVVYNWQLLAACQGCRRCQAEGRWYQWRRGRNAPPHRR
jgi:hypothetical protein